MSNEYIDHDANACKALEEYEKAAQERDEAMFEQIETKHGNRNGRRKNTPYLPSISMQFYADKYHTTIERMKEHWRCIAKI